MIKFTEKLDAPEIHIPIGTYEMEIEFMENDADGYYTELISFHESDLKDPEFVRWLELLIIGVEVAIEYDSKGRGGFDDIGSLFSEYGDIPNWDSFICADWEGDARYDEERAENEDHVLCPIKKLLYEVPTHSEGWYDSYCDLKFFYYAISGKKQMNVEIK